MPVNIVDVDTFTDPIVRPAGSDPKTGTLLWAALQGLANRTRKLWTAVDPTAVVSRTWCAVLPLAFSLGAEWTFGVGGVLGWTSAANLGQFRAPLPKLPPGATITSVRARVTPGAIRAPGSRMRVQLFFHGGVAGGDTAIGSYAEDDGTTGSQTVVQSGLSTVIDDTAYYYVKVNAGNTGAGSPDTCTGVDVVFNDPTPRVPT